MKKIYQILVATSFLFGFSATAQTYSQWGIADANGTIYDYIEQTPDDTLSFTFSGMQPGAYGNPRLVIYFYGYVYSGTNFNLFNQSDSSLIGSQMISGIYCNEDSISFPITPANIDLLQSGGNWSIFFPTNSNFQSYCENSSTMRVRLQYDYCEFGTPVQVASIIADTNFVCSFNTADFTVLPVGGTLVGSGLSGLTFNPSGLNSGNYTFSYTGTDAIGCTTTASTIIRVGFTPASQSILSCEGGYSPVINGLNSEFLYSSDILNTMPIDTAIAYSYGPITQNPEVIYATLFSRGTFTLDTVTNNNATVIDHDNLTGDDRGGMAITDSTVYIVGDNYTGRFDLDLSPASGVALPIRDGLFTDLEQRKIWSLYNSTTSEMPDNDGSNTNNYMVNAIAELDANLELTGTYIPLSQTITMNSGSQRAILSGYGKLGLFNGNELYVVNVNSGVVDSIGEYTFDLEGSENWSDWGNLGYDGAEYFAYYKDNDFDQIVAHNLTTDLITPISQFSDVSDMASFTYHPSNQRLYFHYEGNGQFGGDEETLGYIDANATILRVGNGLKVGCPATIELTFNTLDLGADTSLCPGNIPYIIEPGVGFNSYTWNGVNNNWNVYPVVTAQTVVAQVVDAANCVLTDTIMVSFDNCVGLEELSSDSYAIYPNPNNGTFNIQFGTSVDGVAVSVIDINGRVCHTESFNGTLVNANITTSNLQNGIYFVSVTTNNITTQKAIVVQ